MPPGTGTLNIMMANVKAAKTERSGTVRPLRTLRTFSAATSQNGAAAMYMTPAVAGLM